MLDFVAKINKLFSSLNFYISSLHSLCLFLRLQRNVEIPWSSVWREEIDLKNMTQFHLTRIWMLIAVVCIHIQLKVKNIKYDLLGEEMKLKFLISLIIILTTCWILFYHILYTILCIVGRWINLNININNHPLYSIAFLARFTIIV